MPLPFSPGFTNQFGQTVSAAYPSYASYTISSTTPNQTISLGWATTFQNVPNVVAQIMDVTVTASTAGTIQLPDATQASVGTDFVINNYSDSQSINIVDATGSVLFEISVQSAGSTESSSALIYLSDNSTTGGTWHYINYGGVAGGFNPANVAGPGLEVSTITVANRSTSAATYRIAIRPNAEALANKHYIAYDVALAANDTTAITIGATIDASDVVTVYASTADLSFNIFGSEITA